MKLVCNIVKHQQCFFHHCNLLPPFIFCPAMPAMHNTILKPRMPEMHLPIKWTDGREWESQLMQTKVINFHAMQRMRTIINIVPRIQNICRVTPQHRCHPFFSQKKTSALWGDREESWGRTMFLLPKLKKCFITKLLSHEKSARPFCQRESSIRSLPCLVTLNLLENPNWVIRTCNG